MKVRPRPEAGTPTRCAANYTRPAGGGLTEGAEKTGIPVHLPVGLWEAVARTAGADKVANWVRVAVLNRLAEEEVVDPDDSYTAGYDGF